MSKGFNPVSEILINAYRTYGDFTFILPDKWDERYCIDFLKHIGVPPECVNIRSSDYLIHRMYKGSNLPLVYSNTSLNHLPDGYDIHLDLTAHNHKIRCRIYNSNNETVSGRLGL